MDRRKQAEENYRKKFDEFGLTERFEFLRREWSKDHDKRFWCRCRECGEEFLSWNEVFKGRQKHLICPSCGSASDGDDIWERSQRCSEAMAYYTDGHSVKQTAEKFGVSESQINNSVKKRRLTNGRQWQMARVEDQKAGAERRLIEHLTGIGFEYIGGYSGKDGKAKIRCRKCGTEFERTVDFLKYGNVLCVECQKQETQRRNEEKKCLAAQQAEVRKIEREWYEATHPPKDKRKEALLNRTGICEICGKPYMVRDYVESCGLKQARDNGVCSDDCRKIKINRIVHKSHMDRNIKERAKRHGCRIGRVPSVRKIFDLYDGRCCICGKQCSFDSKLRGGIGPDYPTRGHIIASVNGGDLDIKNLWLVCQECNYTYGTEDESHFLTEGGWAWDDRQKKYVQESTFSMMRR
jgi:hypothetical protein